MWFDSVMNEGITFYIVFPKTMISSVPPSKTPPQYLAAKRGELAVNNLVQSRFQLKSSRKRSPKTVSRFTAFFLLKNI
jgi:hypothetical protein